ncbi:MAG: electron transfer flavoprotein subunit beta/FixA family protein, partial [Sutterella wadsworthensis]
LRTAMAIGADRSIHVSTDEMMEPLAAAKILAKIAEREKPDLILMGKQAIDDDAAQTGPMLSELLNLPLAAFASEIELADGRLIVTRDTDGGTQTISVTLPAVVTADLRLAEPRYVTLPSWQGSQKPVETIELASLAFIQLPARSSLALNRRPHARLG